MRDRPVAAGRRDELVALRPRPALDARTVDEWLGSLGLTPIERDERDGITSWDLLLDGRQRKRLRLTLILDPGTVLVCWVHYAPALNDSFRKSYRQFLRWNDELPFVKFALSEDERPVLSAELPVDALTADALGTAIARLVAVADLLHADSIHWLAPGGRPLGAVAGAAVEGGPDPDDGAALIERYATELGELADEGG